MQGLKMHLSHFKRKYCHTFFHEHNSGRAKFETWSVKSVLYGVCPQSNLKIFGWIKNELKITDWKITSVHAQ